MLWDTHMHSQFSGDSHTPQEDMIAAARQKNLKGICFTDHLDIDYPDEPETFLLDLPNYVSSVDAMQEKYKEVLPVRLGIELGLQPHLACIHADILSQYPFDFVIGSSHVMHGVDPYYPAYWENHTEEEGYQEYFESILENIAVFDGFDVYGHIDYVVRYGPNKNASYSYQKYADIIDEMAGPAGVVGARGRDVSPQRLCRSFETPVEGNRADCMSRAAGRGKRLVLRKNPLNFAVASTVRRRRQDARTLASCSPPHEAAANCRHRFAMPK